MAQFCSETHLKSTSVLVYTASPLYNILLLQPLLFVFLIQTRSMLSFVIRPIRRMKHYACIWMTLRSHMNCAAAVLANINVSTSALERRSCTSKRVSVISLYSPLDYTSWAHQTQHNYSNFALIYSNAVSYLWGNYEPFSRTGDVSAFTKEIVLWKKFCRSQRRGGKKAK